jgi:hypothetical protein
MKTLTYKGPFPNHVTPWNGRNYTVVRGEPIELPDDLADHLKTTYPTDYTTAAARRTEKTED